LQDKQQAQQQAQQPAQHQAQQQAAAQTKAAAAQAKASADSKARRAAYDTKVKDITTPPKAVRELGRHAKRREAAYEKHRARAEAIKDSYLGKAGAITGRIFRWIGLIDPAITLWTTVIGLEDDYKNGFEYNNGQPMTMEDFTAERDFAYGIFATQILAPLLARSLINVTQALWLGRTIKNAVAVAAAPISGGLSIGAALATEAGLMAFAMFLGSNTAQNFLADNIMTWIKGGGWVLTSVVDGLWKLFGGSDAAKELEKDKTKVQNKKALDAATTPQQRQAAQQAIDTTTATQNRADGQADLLKQLK
jgi:hypothetical protein